MIPHQHGVPSGRLGLSGESDQARWLRELTEDRDVDAVTHAHTQAPGTDTSVIRLDLSDYTAITPAATMQVSEPVAVLLQDLSERDRQARADLINQFSQQETDPER
ncbi:hypothetical protein ACFQYP_13185 [Nonomuraea antimicrobica]